MNSVRTEVKIIVRVFSGEDITEAGSPQRPPDAETSVDLVRVADIGHFVAPRDSVASHLAAIGANSMPVLAERLRHQLREKGL